jgi:hypothetical protein
VQCHRLGLGLAALELLSTSFAQLIDARFDARFGREGTGSVSTISHWPSLPASDRVNYNYPHSLSPSRFQGCETWMLVCLPA